MTRLSVSTTIHASLHTVWDVLWDPVHIVHWAFADSATWHCPWAKGIYPRIGDIFTTRMEARDGSFGFDLSGKYTTVVDRESLVYTIGEMKEYFLPAGRVVETSLHDTGSGICVTQIFDAEDIHPHDMQVAGWQSILENMRTYTENISTQV